MIYSSLCNKRSYKATSLEKKSYHSKQFLLNGVRIWAETCFITRIAFNKVFLKNIITFS